MDIQSLVSSINFGSISSEQDVRTKISTHIIEALGYPVEMRAEEFPVYSQAGSTPMPTKLTDTILFDDSHHSQYRKKSDIDCKWVYDHSLLCVELKKPTEQIGDAHWQAKFYAMWTRSLYYICTNGIEIKIYKLEDFSSDKVICDCRIVDLPHYWPDVFAEISYAQLKIEKQKVTGLV